jgi:hypothetical protein
MVYDVSGPKTGYRVVAVDGKAVERAQSPIDTVIPNAVIEPGAHTLSLEHHTGTTATVSASFEAGKRYRLELKNDEVTVAEDSD